MAENIPVDKIKEGDYVEAKFTVRPGGSKVEIPKGSRGKVVAVSPAGAAVKFNDDKLGTMRVGRAFLKIVNSELKNGDKIITTTPLGTYYDGKKETVLTGSPGILIDKFAHDNVGITIGGKYIRCKITDITKEEDIMLPKSYPAPAEPKTLSEYMASVNAAKHPFKEEEVVWTVKAVPIWKHGLRVTELPMGHEVIVKRVYGDTIDILFDYDGKKGIGIVYKWEITNKQPAKKTTILYQTPTEKKAVS